MPTAFVKRIQCVQPLMLTLSVSSQEENKTVLRFNSKHWCASSSHTLAKEAYVNIVVLICKATASDTSVTAVRSTPNQHQRFHEWQRFVGLGLVWCRLVCKHRLQFDTLTKYIMSGGRLVQILTVCVKPSFSRPTWPIVVSWFRLCIMHYGAGHVPAN